MEQFLSWEVVGWVVGILIGIGLGVLALDEFVAAKVCFSLTGMVSVMKIGHWEWLTGSPLYVRIPISILLIGGVGVLCIESLRWVDRIQLAHAKKDAGVAENKPPMIPSPTESELEKAKEAGRSAGATAAGNQNPSAGQSRSSSVPPISNENIRFVGGYNVRPPDLAIPTAPDKLTLYWLFTEDFPQYWIPKIDTRIITDGRENKIESAIFIDFPSRSRFVGFYLPGGVNTFEVCKTLPNAVGLLNAHFDSGHKFKANGIFDKSETSLAELSSTGRVYVYYEDTLSIQEEAQLDALFNKHHLGLILRGDDWLRVNILSKNSKK